MAGHVFHMFESHAGMITYEALMTTAAIALGCRLAARPFGSGSPDHPVKTTHGEPMFFVSIGVISVIVAAFNAQYLM